jgi:hypothetical protein
MNMVRAVMVQNSGSMVVASRFEWDMDGPPLVVKFHTVLLPIAPTNPVYEEWTYQPNANPATFTSADGLTVVPVYG